MANGKRNILPVPFGSLDVQTADIDAPDGMLRLLKNLIRRGNERKSYYSPAEKEKEVYERDDVEEALRGVRAIHVQVRQRAGGLTGGQPDPGTPISAGWYSDGEVIYDDGSTELTVRDLLSVANGHRMAVLDGYIYRWAGQSGGGGAFTNKLERWQPGDAAWAARTSGGGNSWTGGLLADTEGGQLVAFNTGNDDVHAYDPVGNSWSTLSSSGRPKFATGLFYAIDQANRLIYFGGGGSNQEFYVYDIEANDFTQLADHLTERTYAHAEYHDGNVYVFGGRESGTSVALMEIYDVGTGTWEERVMPFAVHAHHGARIGMQVYIAGGVDETSTDSAEMWRYHINTDVWVQLTDLPVDQNHAAGTALGGYFYSTGGDSVSLGTDLVRVFVPLGEYVPGQEPTLGQPSSNERIIAATDEKLYALEPATNYSPTELYEWPDAIKLRKKVQFSQIGDVTFIATSVGGGLGVPTPVLVLVDDQVMPFALPPLPAITITENGSAGKLEAGRYGVRFAWLLKDGTVAKTSRPYTILVSADAELQFAIAAYRAALPSYWSEIISGVQIAVSQKAETGTALELMNAPYFQVAQVRGIAVGKIAKWTDTDVNIPLNYPLFEDDTLMNHGILAGAVTSYNKRLVLGDVAYDFEQPDPLANAIDPDSIGTSTNLAPTLSNFLWDPDEDGNPDTDAGTGGFFFGCVDSVLHLAIEIEDTDGLLIRVAHDPTGDAEGDRVPVGFLQWEGFVDDGGAGFWQTITFGDDENTTPGYSKKRLRIFWRPPAELEGKNISFKITATDDDFGYAERGYDIAILPAGFCDG